MAENAGDVLAQQRVERKKNRQHRHGVAHSLFGGDHD